MQFLDLPDDILFLIRDCIRPSLRAHICFSQVCRRIWYFYADSYWRLCLWDLRAGRPNVNEGGRVPTWQEIAVRFLRHGQTCRLVGCRDTLVTRAGAPLTSLLSLDSALPSAEARFHPLHDLVHCRPSDNTSWPSEGLIEYERVLYAQLPLPTWSGLPGGSHAQQFGPLCYHPNASCVFAIFPPTKTLLLPLEDLTLEVQNPTGVMLLDVSRVIADFILADPTAFIVGIVMQCYGPSRNLASYARSVLNNRGFLKDHHWPLHELLDQYEYEDTWNTPSHKARGSQFALRYQRKKALEWLRRH